MRPCLIFCLRFPPLQWNSRKNEGWGVPLFELRALWLLLPTYLGLGYRRCTAPSTELHKATFVLSNGDRKRRRERERLSVLLSASSIKQERAIDNTDTGTKKKEREGKKDALTHRGTGEIERPGSLSIQTLSAGGSTTQTYTHGRL